MTMKQNPKALIFTGGGSGGHVMPSISIISELLEKYPSEKLSLLYIGSKEGIEKSLIEKAFPQRVAYHGIVCGKLRRYFSWENFIDLLRVFKGIAQSLSILRSSTSDLVFSTGGFVSVPVVIAAKILGKKIIIHEQTTRVGLANKIASFFADKILLSFESSQKNFPLSKTIVTGYPLRGEFYEKELKQKKFFEINFENLEKPLLFITGGGNGSKLLNDKVDQARESLSEKFLIIHQVGKKFIEEFSSKKDDSYYPFSYIGEEMVDIFKASDIIISRAGAGTVCELMALQKKSILVPLKIAQKDEQYFNALEAQKNLGSLVLKEEEFITSSMDAILNDFAKSQPLQESEQIKNGRDAIIEIIQNEL
jgi:UDP-N-acetylglucosamine--N-acetylmuramyl-(pentapeptide) pyrophosphoryl-undecaprenol N-acetylglucosamine transferase